MRGIGPDPVRTDCTNAKAELAKYHWTYEQGLGHADSRQMGIAGMPARGRSAPRLAVVPDGSIPSHVATTGDDPSWRRSS